MEASLVTLDQVRVAFEEWRQSRQSPRERIPESLQQLAVALEGHYRRSQIIAALRLNHTQYMSWLRATTPNEPVSFLAVPSVAEVTGNVVLHHPNGTQLVIQATLTPSQLMAVVRGFVQAEGA